MKIKVFTLAATLILSAVSVFAQKDSKFFVSAQGGASFSVNENSNAYFKENRGWDLFSGGAAISGGYYFTPRVGARLQLEYSHNKSAANYEEWNLVFNPYDFHAFSTYVDCVLNGGNVSKPKLFNWRFFGGIGWAHSFAFSDESFGWGTKYYPISQNNDVFTFRFGFILEWVFRNGVGVYFEGCHEWMTDWYNGVAGKDENGNASGFPFDMKLMNSVGISYHF